MKTIMQALVALAVLGGIAAPASAETYVTMSAEAYARLPASEKRKYEVVRRHVPRQIEYDASTLPTGTGIWWQQMDREQRGGRR